MSGNLLYTKHYSQKHRIFIANKHFADRRQLVKPLGFEGDDIIGKEEILAAIRDGLLEIKERRQTGKKGIRLHELINEL